jgi:hypothetical protein
MSLDAASCASRLHRVDAWSARSPGTGVARPSPVRFPFLQYRDEPNVENARTRDEYAMTTTMLLRIATVISLVFTAGHSLGGLRKWSPMGENEVLKAMTAVRFETMGAKRSYLDFFMGFGWSISVAMLLQTVLLWQLAALAQPDPARVRPMIAVFALATLISGVIAWRFIFPVPALFSGALAIVLAAAYLVAR